MKNVLPWTLVAVVTVAAVASFSEFQRFKTKYGAAHQHADVRTDMIRWAAAGLDAPIVVLGDSITEMARFPDTIAGHPVVNAGIGGANIAATAARARALLDGVKPALIVVAVGMNDRGSGRVRSDYTNLLALLRPLAPLLCIGVTPADGANAVNAEIEKAAGAIGLRVVDVGLPAGETVDGVHPTHAGLAVIVPAAVRAIENALKSPESTRATPAQGE